MGSSQCTLKFFFSKCVNIGHIKTLWKKIDNQMHGSFLFYQRQLLILKTNHSLQILKCFIDNSINLRSFVKFVKIYRWDMLVYIMQIKTISASEILSAFFSHTSYRQFFVPHPDIFGHKLAERKVFFLSYFQKTFKVWAWFSFSIAPESIFIAVCHFVFLSICPKRSPC